MTAITQISIILLTGPSSAGKSHLATKLSESGKPVLDNDREIMRRIFDLLPGEVDRRLHEHIGDERKWHHIRRYLDFDRLVRLHHRDWFVRNSCPHSFVAAGWMYSGQTHRDQVKNAFRQVVGSDAKIQIARLHPPVDVFIQRYCERHDRTNEVAWQEITARGNDARNDHARSMYHHYFQSEWQAPTDGTPWGDVQDIEDVLRLLE